MDPDQVAGPVADAIPEEGAAQGPSGISTEPQQASAEEQDLYNRFVSKAFMLIYDEKFLPKAVDMLAGEGDPKEGLARLTSSVVVRIMKAAKESGAELGGDVLFHGAKEIFEDLAELSRVSGVFDYSQDPDALEGAYFRALDHFRMTLQEGGEIDQPAAQADLDMLQKMDAEGKLEGMFLDLAARDGASASAGEEEAEEVPEGAETEEPAPRKRGLMPQGMQ